MSEIKVDTLTGKTSAGDITVTSEGGAATMQLQQGLAKAWGHFEGSDAILDDSLNTSSLTDVGTGDFQINFSNDMDSVNYAAATASRDTGIISNRNGGYTTTSYQFVVRNSAFTAVDRDDTTYVVHGDLA